MTDSVNAPDSLDPLTVPPEQLLLDLRDARLALERAKAVYSAAEEVASEALREPLAALNAAKDRVKQLDEQARAAMIALLDAAPEDAARVPGARVTLRRHVAIVPAEAMQWALQHNMIGLLRVDEKSAIDLAAALSPPPAWASFTTRREVKIDTDLTKAYPLPVAEGVSHD